jgi:hypothetical protein
MFEKHIQTRAQYIKELKVNHNNENGVGNQLNFEELEKEEVASIMHKESEERAMLIF